MGRQNTIDNGVMPVLTEMTWDFIIFLGMSCRLNYKFIVIKVFI